MTSDLDFFISYNGADGEWAEWIAWQLEDAGYRTRIQAWDFRPGANFVLEMHEAAQTATRTLCVLSRSFLGSGFTAVEWAAAFRADATGQARALVPVRVEDCDPGGLLATIVYIDLVGADEPEARARLLAGVSAGRAKPETRPRFPSETIVAGEAPPSFPGRRSGTIWNVPVPTRTFTGRRQVLATVGERLRGGALALTQAATIHGLGGVGKTQVAARFARMKRHEYTVVWWIRAEAETTLLNDYCQLGVALGLFAPAQPSNEETARTVLHWLESNAGWLLIFDNVTDSRTIASLVPEGPAGDVLITSRRPADWQEIGAASLALDVWDRTEAIDFLLRRTGRQDSEGAEAVAELLGDLPLALEQAAAYALARGVSFGEYARRWSERSEELLSHGRPLAYADTVFTTWQLAFDAIGDKPTTALTLAVCALLAPDAIPRAVLEAIMPADREAVEDALGSLASHGLVSLPDTDNVSVHRLVSHIVRGRLLSQADSYTRVVAVALNAISACCPRDVYEPEAWPEFRRLLPHALALLERIPDSSATPRAATLRFLVANWYAVNERLADAVSEWRRVLSIESRLYGEQHPLTVRVHANLGAAFAKLKQWVDAEKELELAIELSALAFGPDSAESASEMENLATVYAQKGELARARDLYQEALSRITRVHPADREQPFLRRACVTLRLNLAGALRDLGLHTDELEQLRRADRDARDLFPASHPIHGDVQRALALCLMACGTFDEAEQHLEKAVRSHAEFGAERLGALKTAASLESLARLLLVTGRSERASQTLEGVLALLRAHCGPCDQSLVAPLVLSAVARAGMHDEAASVAAVREALDIIRLADDDPTPTISIEGEHFDYSNLDGAAARLLTVASSMENAASNSQAGGHEGNMSHQSH